MGGSGLHIQEAFLLTLAAVVSTRSTAETNNRHFKGYHIIKEINLEIFVLYWLNNFWTEMTIGFIPKCYIPNWFFCTFFARTDPHFCTLAIPVSWTSKFQVKFWLGFQTRSNIKRCQQDGWVYLKLEFQSQAVKNHQIRVNSSQSVFIHCSYHLGDSLQVSQNGQLFSEYWDWITFWPLERVILSGQEDARDLISCLMTWVLLLFITSSGSHSSYMLLPFRLGLVVTLNW